MVFLGAKYINLSCLLYCSSKNIDVLRRGHGKLTKKPYHIAISLDGIKLYSVKHKILLKDAYKRAFIKIKNMLALQVKENIPIVTLYVLPSEIKEESARESMIDAFVEFLDSFKINPLLFENKVKVSIIGKWYDLPSRAIDQLKDIIEETKDYDSFFLNLCVNYDGREEIVDACRLIARKIAAGRIDPEAIDASDIKDNIYSSYFLPPDLVIKTGKSRRLKGFLLWDTTHSHIYFADKGWLELSQRDFMKAIEKWKKS